MNKILIVSTMCFLIGQPAWAETVSENYKAHQFPEIIKSALKNPDAFSNDENLYYLALSYAQTKNYSKAKEILLTLLNHDSSFYAYKIKYDLDLYDLLKQTDLNAVLANQAGEIMTSYQSHQVNKTANGLYLYRNGTKTLLLSDASQVVAANFIDEENFYFVTVQQPQTKKDEAKSRVYFYSAKTKTTTSQFELQGQYASVLNLGLTRFLVQTGKGFQIFDKKALSLVTPFLIGNYLAEDTLKRRISYSQMNVKTKSSDLLSYTY